MHAGGEWFVLGMVNDRAVCSGIDPRVTRKMLGARKWGGAKQLNACVGSQGIRQARDRTDERL